ncbi:hypothetical protein HDU98_011939 [Podochytrium sp. JEL0797]|nr:hypothetical protein HDU98_011939 [Podochytrium sp. JEL0797]
MSRSKLPARDNDSAATPQPHTNIPLSSQDQQRRVYPTHPPHTPLGASRTTPATPHAHKPHLSHNHSSNHANTHPAKSYHRPAASATTGSVPNWAAISAQHAAAGATPAAAAAPAKLNPPASTATAHVVTRNPKKNHHPARPQQQQQHTNTTDSKDSELNQLSATLENVSLNSKSEPELSQRNHRDAHHPTNGIGHLPPATPPPSHTPTSVSSSMGSLSSASPSKRPIRTDAVARRLIAGALGVKMAQRTPEQEEIEKQKVQLVLMERAEAKKKRQEDKLLQQQHHQTRKVERKEPVVEVKEVEAPPVVFAWEEMKPGQSWADDV